MNSGIDELKLTAYALGELEGDDRTAVEAHLAGDAAARAQVAEVRATARLLASELAREPQPELTERQHAAIERRLEGAGADDATEARLTSPRRNWGLWASVAASTLIVCTVMAAVMPRLLPVGGGSGGGAAPPGGGQDAGRGPIIIAPSPGEPVSEPAAGAGEPEPAGGGVTLIEVEKAPERVAVRGLGTGGYRPTDMEKKYLEQTPEEERTIGSILDNNTGYDLAARRGRRVAWFGIVREVGKVQRGGAGGDDTYELLLEHKYFDGLTDLHILALSFNGAGDFKARVRTRDKALPIQPLMLVRVYGKVAPADVAAREPAGNVQTGQPPARPTEPPTVEVEYARVFPWKTFTFLDAYGKDASNPRWRRLCKVPLDRIYQPAPTDNYYRQRLGDEPAPATTRQSRP